MKIAVLGTGMVGNAIATKLVNVGQKVMMGSRTANSDAGQEWLRSVSGKAQIGTFADAAAFGETVFDCTNGANSIAALRSAGVRFTAYQYPGTQHGFNNDTTPRYDAAAAQLAWSRTVDFLKVQLGGAG